MRRLIEHLIRRHSYVAELELRCRGLHEGNQILLKSLGCGSRGVHTWRSLLDRALQTAELRYNPKGPTPFPEYLARVLPGILSGMIEKEGA